MIQSEQFNSSTPHRVALFVLLLIASWCVMCFTHEAGHIVGGWLGGGTLTAASLWPWTLPWSIFEPDPYPLVTLWSGPLLGVVVPLVFAVVVRHMAVWFIADFCLLANGTYLFAAWISGDRHLDTPRLLTAGAHPISLVVYCAVTIGVGYWWFRKDCRNILLPPTTRDG
jgi:hypothetical protein